MHATQEKQVSNSVQVKTIVVLLDSSALAEKIFAYVVEISKALASEVILDGTYSLPRTSYSLKRFHVPYTNQLAESVKNTARTYLERKVQEFTAKGVARVSYRMMEDRRGVEKMNLAKHAS